MKTSIHIYLYLERKALNIYRIENMLRTNAIENKKFWKEVTVYFPLLRYGPHRRRCVPQSFNCCVCICCHGKVFTEPLPRNGRRVHIDT
jgi:hypothetical protein